MIIGKRGQAALEFLMTYGWAFLVMVAVIAGIVALDPLSMAQTNINSCGFNQPFSCESDTMIVNSTGEMKVRFTNRAANTMTLAGFWVNAKNDQASSAGNCVSSNQVVSPGESVTVVCNGSSGQDLNATVPGPLIASQSYQLEANLTYFETTTGPGFTKQKTAQIRFQPQ